MPLKCSCDWDYDFEPGDKSVCVTGKEDFEPLSTKKRKRCSSCSNLIDIGAPAIRFEQYRYPYTEVEARIRCGVDLENSFADEPIIRANDIFLCEGCGEIFFNLFSAGFRCVYPTENMPELLKEYQAMHKKLRDLFANEKI